MLSSWYKLSEVELDNSLAGCSLCMNNQPDFSSHGSPIWDLNGSEEVLLSSPVFFFHGAGK